jgi:hypothetical protein
MLYKNGKKFIFVHIPKNAGNTIRKSIFGLPNDDVKLVNRIENNIELSSIMNEHLTYDDHLEKYKKQNSHDLFSFCFIRNPYERFISTYNYLSNEYFLKSGCLIRKETSELFLDKKTPIDVLIFLNKNKNHSFFKDRQGYLQTDFIGTDKQVDFIGLVENFKEDINLILKTLGFETINEMDIVNKGNSKFIELVDNKKFRELIESIYYKDIELYNQILNKNKSVLK